MASAFARRSQESARHERGASHSPRVRQIALFVAPVLVLLSYVMGPAPMSSSSGRRGRDDADRDVDGEPDETAADPRGSRRCSS